MEELQGVKDDIAGAEALATQLEDLHLSLELLELEVGSMHELSPGPGLLRKASSAELGSVLTVRLAQPLPHSLATPHDRSRISSTRKRDAVAVQHAYLPPSCFHL